MNTTTMNREKPILMSGEMVRAILAGRKTQTRRIVKGEWFYDGETGVGAGWEPPTCRHGQPGDRLWVRETWAPMGDMRPSGMWTDPKWIGRNYWYAADNDRPTWGGEKWKPSIFMPREACRVVLEIADVRVERLNDISEADAIAEGIEGNAEGQWKHYLKPKFGPSPVHSFQTLWESVRKPGAWAENPWVWVISFRRMES